MWVTDFKISTLYLIFTDIMLILQFKLCFIAFVSNWHGLKVEI
jgi:hypothetical protein